MEFPGPPGNFLAKVSCELHFPATLVVPSGLQTPQVAFQLQLKPFIPPAFAVFPYSFRKYILGRGEQGQEGLSGGKDH